MSSEQSKVIIAPIPPAPDWAKSCINLADARLGASTVLCSDDFFGSMERMLQPGPAVFDPDKYDENGKWMDGWETRRRRRGGNDWCVVKLARPGRILGVDFDTSFFTGNYPPAAALEACEEGKDINDPASWQTLLGAMPLGPNQHHPVQIPVQDIVVSHIRLQIFPDGGIARLRVYGIPVPDLNSTTEDGLIDLISATNGGRALAWNDSHYGNPANLLYPGRGIHMGDGWETRRRRSPGFDWCLLALGIPGKIKRIEIDTAHFKGNYPDRISLQGANLPIASDESANAIEAASQFWDTLLAETPLQADHIHIFQIPESDAHTTHLRLNVYPDGGISRLRVYGKPG